MDLKKLTGKAKDVIEKRASTDSLKRDAEHLKGIARGEGSISEKAKAAVSAIKDPEPGEEEASAAAEASPEERERAEEKVEHEHHGKYAHPEEMHEQS